MLNHGLELRRRLFGVILFFSVCFVICFYYSQELLAILVHPLVAQLSDPHDALIITHVTAPLLAPLQLALDGAFLCTLPFVLLSSWRFISPGLYQNERHIFACLLITSLSLFVFGLLFCFYVVLPNLFYVIVHSRPEGVLLMPDMTESIGFIVYFLVLFGFCFQLPLLLVILVYTHLLTLSTLGQIRPYVIVAAFVVGMLLTPPDVLSQVMLAIPLCFLYELGIVLSRILIRYHQPA